MATKKFNNQGDLATVTETDAMADAVDQAYAKALRLEALLANSCGDAADSFFNMADNLRENYLWACLEFATDIRVALAKVA